MAAQVVLSIEQFYTRTSKTANHLQNIGLVARFLGAHRDGGKLGVLLLGDERRDVGGVLGELPNTL